MARIRSIKPDAFKSDSLARVPREVRWTFAGLWTYLDDQGRGRYDPRLIKAEIYPLEDSVTPADVHAEIQLLVGIGSVCIYEEGGKQFIHCPAWLIHQKINRPTASKLPECTRSHEPVSLPPLPLTDDSVSPHGALTGGKGTGNREGEQGKPLSLDRSDRAKARTTDVVPDGFNDWWDAYDKKVGKAKALTKYAAAIKRTDPARILTATQIYVTKQKLAGKHPEFTKDPATWLNGRHWEDEWPADKPVGPAYRHVADLETPPDGLTPEAEMQWWRDRRAQ